MQAFDHTPLISVIVPVYQTEPYLRRCLDSILTQTYSALEIVVVDDGSPDQCPIICDEYARKDSRVQVIHKENGGVSSARNAALEISQGEYVAFVDSDDYIAKDYFSQLIQYEADIIVSGRKAVSGLHYITAVKENWYNWGGFTGPCEKLYRRKTIGNIRFREDIPVGEDGIFNLNLLNQVNTVYYVPYSGYYVENNPNSLTRRTQGKYDLLLDEEWQKYWGEIQATAIQNAGIPQEVIATANANGCSVWIFQKIRNYFYPDCPLPYKEKIRRIKNQLDSNRERILSATSPISPKTYALIRLCITMRSPHVTHFLFRFLSALHII